MDVGYVLMLLVALTIILVLVIVKLFIYFKAFTKETQQICYNIECAENTDEYNHWRKELHCHYLTLIPFVTKKNVMRVYHVFFHKGEQERKEEKKDSIIPLLLPSIIGIFACLFCICGMTWAWYSASVDAPTQKLVSAYYDVKVETVILDTNTIEVTDGGYALDSGKEYTIHLRADGTVKECGGYCLIGIKGKDTKYYTQTILPNQDIVIHFTPIENGIYTFVGVWGSVPSSVLEENVIRDVNSNLS